MHESRRRDFLRRGDVGLVNSLSHYPRRRTPGVESRPKLRKKQSRNVGSGDRYKLPKKKKRGLPAPGGSRSLKNKKSPLSLVSGLLGVRATEPCKACSDLLLDDRSVLYFMGQHRRVPRAPFCGTPITWSHCGEDYGKGVATGGGRDERGRRERIDRMQ